MRVRALGLVAGAALTTSAFASPVINGAVVNERIFNDDPGSTLVSTNSYPGSIVISDTRTGGGGFANLHNWRASADGGATAVNFANGDSFSLFADFSLTGGGSGEGGLSLAPWWSQNVDGRFNLRTTDGEVAVFGGRLPFYSFTGSQGVTYTAGTTVRLGIIYSANGLSSADPATIEYIYDDGSMVYTSGVLAFDEGNPNEPYGTWGMLDNAQIGGYMQVFNTASNLTGTWGNIVYTPTPSSAALLGIGGLLATRRRR